MKPTKTYKKVIRGNHGEDTEAHVSKKESPHNVQSVHRAVVRARIDFLLDQTSSEAEPFTINR